MLTNEFDSISSGRRDAALERAEGINFEGWLEQQRSPTDRSQHYLRLAEQVEQAGGADLAKLYRQFAEEWRNRKPWSFDPSSYEWPENEAAVSSPVDLHLLRVFTADYQRVLAHWRHVQPIPWLDIQYEDVVVDLERHARRLLDFVGLDWHPACLEFHSHRRVVRTPSHAQVRQPIHSRSVGRWRRYEALAPA